MKKTFCIAVSLVVALSCVKEQPRGGSLTITAGFEQPGEVKTYLNANESGAILWSGTSANDKVVYGFTSTGAKKAFLSTSESNESTRAFTCEDWPGGAWTYAIWTGKTEKNDYCTLSDGVFTGSSLKLPATQSINNSKSFNNSSNIAVMKPGDGALRNVFGYLRFTLPDYPGLANRSALKYVTFTADEPVAGEIRIDYSGADPVATVIDNANASRSITLNVRLKGSGPQGYEAGNVYMILPPGTYHNAQLTLTPFTSEPLTSEATTGEPFTVPFDGNVIIQRGKYADVGALPATDPSPAPGPDPGPTWPTPQEGDFDYNIAPGAMHKASYSGLGLSGNTSISEPKTATDYVTYGGPGLNYYGNRIQSDHVKNSDYWSTEYPNVIPSQRYFSFKINRPGTLRFYPAPASKDGDVLRIPTYYLAVVKTVGGVTTAEVVDSYTPAVEDAADGTVSDNRQDANVYSEAYRHYWVTLTVPKEKLEGIDSAATVYLYHRKPGYNSVYVHYWPLEWTVADAE